MRAAALFWAAAVCLSLAAGTGATTNWVVRYVDSRVSEITRNMKTTTTETGQSTAYTIEGVGSISNVVEAADVGALECRSATDGNAYGITNGTLFAWNGTSYQSGTNVITATKTALAIGPYSTMILDGGCWLADAGTNRLCRLYSTLLQQSVADKVLNGGL